MVCKNCGKEFEGNFCPECGAKAEVQEPQQEPTSCPNCGAERLDDGKFCVNCGYSYVEPAQDVQPTQSVAQVVEDSNVSSKNGGKKLGGGNFLKVFPKIYRWLHAGGMLLVGLISLLCLTAPVITENFLGESNPLCSGFEAISGKDTTMPAAVGGASKMLLVLSILALVYGGVQLFFAFKKPYINTIGKNKFIFWGIDGVISVLLIVSGGIMSSQAKSESLMDGKLGAGFAFAIVMGVFGLLFLASRIFYELKLFKIEDTGLSEEQIAKLTEKKERKKLTKKQIMAIVISAVTVAVLVAVIVPSVIWANNIFRVGKVDKINIGDSQEQVIKVLGEPYEKNDYRYEYYSKEYVQLADKYNALSEDLFGNLEQLAKLEEQLNALTYQYIRVDFDSDKKVTEVFFDNAKSENGEVKKAIKSYDVQGETTIQQYDTLNLTYKVNYTDGSFYKATAYNQIIFDLTYKVEWSDRYGNKYSAKISVSPITTLTSYIVTKMAGGDKSTLTEIIIPSSVTSIGDKAFKGCSSLTSITFGDNSQLTNIGYDAFYNCSSLTSVTIPSSVTSIVSSAFWGCRNITTATIPTQAISFIPKDSLSTVVINGGTSIGEEAFYHCYSLTSVTIPNSVTSIGDRAFNNCWLTSVTIPSSVTSIGSEAFYGDMSIYCEAASKPSGWDSSWNYDNRPVVWDCKEHGVTDNGIKWGLTNSGIMTIAGYSGTSTEIVIPSVINGYSVTSIGSYAFSWCSSLTSIEIPGSVTRIGNRAFSSCNYLRSVTFENTSGWYVTKDSDATSGTSVSVTNASTNATYLKSTYYDYYWKRNA